LYEIAAIRRPCIEGRGEDVDWRFVDIRSLCWLEGHQDTALPHRKGRIADWVADPRRHEIVAWEQRAWNECVGIIPGVGWPWRQIDAVISLGGPGLLQHRVSG